MRFFHAALASCEGALLGGDASQGWKPDAGERYLAINNHLKSFPYQQLIYPAPIFPA